MSYKRKQKSDDVHHLIFEFFEQDLLCPFEKD